MFIYYISSRIGLIYFAVITEFSLSKTNKMKQIPTHLIGKTFLLKKGNNFDRVLYLRLGQTLIDHWVSLN